MLRYPRLPLTDEKRSAKLSISGVARLFRLVAPYRWWLALAGFLTLFSSAATLAMPLISQRAIDQLRRTQRLDELHRTIYLIAGLMLLTAVVGYAQYLLGIYSGNRIVMDLRKKLFSHMQRLPAAYFDRTRSGDLTSRLWNDVAMLQATLTGDVVRLPGNLLVLFGGIAVALYIDRDLTVVVAGILTVTMAGFVASGLALRKLTRKSLDAMADAMGSMTEAMANNRLVKAFAREWHEDARIDQKLFRVFRLTMRSARWEGLTGAVATAGAALVILGVLWYGGQSVLEGRISVGKLVAFIMVILVINGPMSSLSTFWSRLQRAVGAADRLVGILDEPDEPPDPADAVPFPAGVGQVEMRSIDFAYVADAPVLRGLSLTLPAGKVTAIVGPSGSGKSTVASLLYRFYHPLSGVISIDGVPISSIRRQSLREHVGIVPQDTVLFDGSIRENIRYGRLDAGDDEVEAAARAANVDEFVRGFPQGYDTLVGERGVKLSGGQRQRVAIARVMLKDPRILVLDEATSALDTISESLVREALDRLMQGRTTLVIAHRLSTVQNSHQIAVLADGRIVEQGAHAELLRAGGRYAELYELVAG